MVLTSVTLALNEALVGARLTGFRRQNRERFGLLWERGEQPLTTVVSMRPESPWLGRPGVRISSKDVPQRTFEARVRRVLVGASLASVRKPGADRWIEFRFGSAGRLIVELAVHGANLVLLDAQGRVDASLNAPASAMHRLVVGTPWLAPSAPTSLLDPSKLDAAAIDALVRQLGVAGETPFEALRRHLFGVGTPAATLVCEEASPTRSHGERLAARLVGVTHGELVPVVETREHPMTAAREGRFNATSVPLWPWTPARDPRDGSSFWSGADAAETAGCWYDARDFARRQAARRQGFAVLLKREHARNVALLRRVEGDLAKFEDPTRFKLWAEAILAGLQQAERLGALVKVPDPSSHEGADLLIPAAPGVALPRVADALFAQHRRAVRGLARVRERLDELQGKGSELAELRRVAEDPTADEKTLVARMKVLRLPVGLEPTTRAGRRAAATRAPRMEGVRVYYATTGEMILAGKGAKENHRLTFQLAAPHDFWLHAAGVPGAHVVLRNEAREPRPGAALEEAAGIAAFHSEARSESWADVQWTLRKNVKKPRGAARGVVVLKRFETIRVRPALPLESP